MFENSSVFQVQLDTDSKSVSLVITGSAQVEGRGSYLSRDPCDVIRVDFGDKDDDEDIVHLILGHVVEHRLQSRLQVTLQFKTRLLNSLNHG